MNKFVLFNLKIGEWLKLIFRHKISVLNMMLCLEFLFDEFIFKMFHQEVSVETIKLNSFPGHPLSVFLEFYSLYFMKCFNYVLSSFQVPPQTFDLFHTYKERFVSHVSYPWCFFHITATPHFDVSFYLFLILSVWFEIINSHTVIVVNFFKFNVIREGYRNGLVGELWSNLLPRLNTSTTSEISSAQWTGRHRWSLLLEPVTTCHLPFDLCSKPTSRLPSVNIGHPLHPRHTGGYDGSLCRDTLTDHSGRGRAKWNGWLSK